MCSVLGKEALRATQEIRMPMEGLKGEEKEEVGASVIVFGEGES